jgi:hypothetical protein
MIEAASAGLAPPPEPGQVITELREALNVGSEEPLDRWTRPQTVVPGQLGSSRRRGWRPGR